MHKAFLTAYYTFLGLMTLGMVIFTIYSGSQAVSYGQTVADLEKQQKALIAQQTHLKQQLNQEVSFTTVRQQALNSGFVATTKLVQVPTSTQVALR